MPDIELVDPDPDADRFEFGNGEFCAIPELRARFTGGGPGRTPI